MRPVSYTHLSFDSHLQMLPVGHTEESLLAGLGKIIAPIFTPLGFGFWQAAVALLSGFVAKEAVVGTLTILYNPVSDAAMSVSYTHLREKSCEFPLTIFVSTLVYQLFTNLSIENLLNLLGIFERFQSYSFSKGA